MRTDLLDDDGENKAVRAFLGIYASSGGVGLIKAIVKHLNVLGWNDHPDWVDKVPDVVITKALAQLWIRHLLSLEQAQPRKCWCTTCRPITPEDMRFVVCPDCGNKRCPKASDHRLACTGSNDVGQEGSIFTAPPKREWVGLTDEEIGKLHRHYGENSINGFDHVKAFARAIEAKIKEKNT